MIARAIISEDSLLKEESRTITACEACRFGRHYSKEQRCHSMIASL